MLRQTFSLFPLLLLAVAFQVFLPVTVAHGQNQSDDVHIRPRVEPEGPKDPLSTIDPALRTHTKPVKVDVKHGAGAGHRHRSDESSRHRVDRENFTLFEGKEQQEVRTFSSEDAPVSLGVIFDMSGSMSSKIDRAREAVVEFFKTANPVDEFFMVTFSDKPEEIADFTSSVDEIQGKLVYTVPKGRTALLDAIYLGSQQNAPGEVCQESDVDHLRRWRQSQPLHRE